MSLRTHPSLPTGLSRNALWTLLGNVTKLAIQALYFVLIARYLGPGQYGSFVAVAAAVAIASPFVGNGYDSLMIKHVARDRSSYATCLGNLLAVTLASGLLLAMVVMPACILLLPRSIPPIATILIAAADLMVSPLTMACGAAFWSLEKLRLRATFDVLVSLARLVGLITLLVAGKPTLTAWATVYMIATVTACFITCTCLLLLTGMPRFDLGNIHRELWEGFHFSVGMSAQSLYNDIDKTMLARLGTLDATGIYGAAYRLIDVAFVPVRSLLYAAYPSFFRAGKQGIRNTIGHGFALLRRTVPYSLFASVAIFACAPLLPLILGHQYAEVTSALRWLAVLPLLKTLHYFVGDAITGAGHQGLRTLAQIAIAIFNIALNFWLLPHYGWRGAAWASIASDGSLAVALWSLAFGLANTGQAQIARTALETTN